MHGASDHRKGMISLILKCMDESVEHFTRERSGTDSRAYPPAAGERRAAVGYSAEYLVKAELILDELLRGGLQWIRIADPTAGSVDDIIIGTDGRVDAYQIKWGQHPRAFAFHNLIGATHGSPNLLAQLADGWKECRRQHTFSRVVVHLLTNRYPSTNAGSRPNHFAAFISQVWNPVSTAPISDPFEVPQEWSQIWREFTQASGLSEEEFRSFIKDCELEFGQKTHREKASSNLLDGQFRHEDIDSLAHELWQIAAAPRQLVHLSRDDLIRRMAWDNRFGLNNTHRFPVDQKLYRHIATTSDELVNAIDELPGGFLALLGSPGAGKSSLLTETLKDLDARVVRYYAYVPDAAGPTSLRGESESFLHDVATELDRLGFKTGSSTRRRDRHLLVSQFHQQLQLLHRDWQCSGRKSVILIDGLDHIEREQNPDRSLLEDLPRSEEVPEGVYFVLGTQTTRCLPSHLRSTFTTEPRRRVEMRPLDRQQVVGMIRDSGIEVGLTREQCDRAFHLSGGHPLYTNYLINQLRACADGEQIAHLLQNSASYQGEIEALYETHWNKFEEDFELQRLLGLLARIRRAIDMRFVHRWADLGVLKRLMLQFSHFFRTDEENRWYFFHNSFRLFLIEKTSQILPGYPDRDADRELHSELANHCASAGEGKFWDWEELHHRIEAGQRSEVLGLATQNHFRRQLLDLRPHEAIQTDLIGAIRLAGESEDAVALVRLLLAGSELEQRQNFLDHIPKLELLNLVVALGQCETAIEHLRDGNRLRVDESTALLVSIRLAASGFHDEGERVFRLAEPLEILNGDKSPSSAPMLMEWAGAAAVFTPVGEIIAQIQQVRYLEDSRRCDAETMTGRLRLGMLQTAGLALAKSQNWDAASQIADAFDPATPDEAAALFWLRFRLYEHAQSKSDGSRAKQYAQSMADMDTTNMSGAELTALAEVAYRCDGDKDRASELISNVDEPRFPSARHHLVEDLKDYAHRIRFNRLVFALGDRRVATDYVPEAENQNDVGMVALERSVCELAQIWGRAWSGEVLDAGALGLLVLPLIRRFAETGEKIGEIGRWYDLYRRRTEFYLLIVDAIADHGKDAIYALAETFEQEWNDNDRQWPFSDRRRVILSLRRRGMDREWARVHLQTLDDAPLNDFDVAERVEQNFRQAQAWCEIGDRAQAEGFLRRTVKTGFGVAYSKDYQLNLWVQWLGRMNEADPSNAPDRISRFLAALEKLRDTIESRPFRSACEQLILVTSMTSPVAAVRLTLQLLDDEMIGYQSAVESLLKGALRSNGASTRITTEIFNELIVPFDPEADSQLTNELVRNIHEHSSGVDGARTIDALVSAIRRLGPPSTRPGWLRGVVEGRISVGANDTRLGIRNEELGLDDDDVSTGDRFRFKNCGGTLYKDEVARRVSSAGELRELMLAEHDESHFWWAPVVQRLAHETQDFGELEDINQLFSHRREASEIRSILSERLGELGAFERAWELGVDAVNVSSKWDWYERSGGARFKALRALACVNRSDASLLIYRTIFSDLEESPGLVTSIVEEIAPIVDLLEVSDQMLPIWQEIEPYIGELMSSDGASVDRGLFEDAQGVDTWDAALIMFMASYVDHACLTLAQSAIRGLGKLTLAGEKSVAANLERLLSQSEGFQERALMLLHALSTVDPDALEWARLRVFELADSENWCIRKRARAVAQNCDWDLSISKQPILPLSGVYSLSIPSNKRDLELITPLALDVDIIASIAGVNPSSVNRRVVETMESLAPRGRVWSENAERAFASSLANAGFRLPYIKPRFRVLRRALNHVVCELADSGRIPTEAIEVVEEMLRDYDPDLVLVEPVDRPSEISPFSDLEVGVDKHEWISNARDSLPLTGLDWVDRRLVLAEATRFKLIGDRRKLVETRWSAIAPLTAEINEAGLTVQSLFGSVIKGVLKEYPPSNPRANVAVRNKDYGYDSPGSDWIALNPSIAAELGWSRVADGLFRWVDDEGNVMVQSYWWADGNVELDHAGFGPNQVGSGWVILATERAIRQIEEWYGTSSRGSIVVREAHGQSGFVENAASTIRPVEASSKDDIDPV